MMNKLFTLLFVLLSSSLVAQNWEVLAEDVDYRIEKTHIICNSTQGYDYDYTLLNFENLSNQALELSFNMERWYNADYCHGCADGDHNTIRTLIIPANSSITGTCSSSEDYLKIFDHSNTNAPTAWKSKLTALVINKIESIKK